LTAVQDYYPEDAAHCYGCGRLNETGYHLKTEWQNGESVTRFAPDAHQTSMPGFVYGGLIASLVDCHAMATAAADAETAARRAVGEREVARFVTASLRVDYLRPTPLGHALELRGRVTQRTERKAVVDVTVSAAGEVTARGHVVAVRLPDSMR
jgi:acyl-coenzyme A thioesterase PaaI-like protein